MNLYQIEQELLDIYSIISENDGEITPEIEERLAITEGNFAQKLENYSQFITSLNGEVNVCKSEIERINKLIATKQNLITRLQANMLTALRLFGNKDPRKDIWRYDLPTYKLSTRQSTSVDILNETEIDDKFKSFSLSHLTAEQERAILALYQSSEIPENISFSYTISKTAIKNAIADGEEVEGAEVKINYSLVIK